MALHDDISARIDALMQTHGERGPRLAHIAKAVAATVEQVRNACETLVKQRMIHIVRWGGRAMHIIPFGSVREPLRICQNCGLVFEAPFLMDRGRPHRKVRNKRKNCGRSCAVASSWKNEDIKARRSIGIQKSKRTNDSRERQTELNRSRWSRPGEREKLSERNRKRWADPETKVKLSIAIGRTRTTELRETTSERLKRQWRDPEWRNRQLKLVRAAQMDTDLRKRRSEIMRQRWVDPILRKKYTRANSFRAKAASAKGHAARKKRREEAAKARATE